MRNLKSTGMSQGTSSRRIDELKNRASMLMHLVKEQEHNSPTGDLRTALEEFRQFFDEYLAYFQQEQVLRQFDGQITRERVLATALEKTLEQWATLSRAVNQRHNPVYAKALKGVETEEWEALKQRFQGYIQGRSPIIYFEKLYRISRYPYRAYPLLAIPFDQYGQEGLSAMAHEMGHWVFWNSGDLDEYRQRLQNLRREIARLVFEGENVELNLDDLERLDGEMRKKLRTLNVLDRWGEEVSADTFAALVRGPAYAKSAQDLQVRRGLGVKRDLVRDDGTHPMPCLRPLISIEVLKAIRKTGGQDLASLDELITALEERWEPYVRAGMELDDEEARHGHGHDIEDPVLPKDLKAYVPAVIEAILNTDLLPPGDGAGEGLKPLMSQLEYWGKANDNDAVKAEVKELLEDLKMDELPGVPPTPKTVEPVTTRRARAPEGDPASPFARLLGHVRSERGRLSKAGETLHAEEGEYLLGLDLSMDSGHYGTGIPYGSCATHWHRIYHYHSWSGVVLC